MTTFLDEIAAEIEAEKSGLEARYQNEVSDAGFLLAAMENEEASPRSAARAEALTTSIMRCERRLETLSRQAVLMRDIVRLLDGFADAARQAEGDAEPARASA